MEIVRSYHLLLKHGIMLLCSYDCRPIIYYGRTSKEAFKSHFYPVDCAKQSIHSIKRLEFKCTQGNTNLFRWSLHCINFYMFMEKRRVRESKRARAKENAKENLTHTQLIKRKFIWFQRDKNNQVKREFISLFIGFL